MADDTPIACSLDAEGMAQRGTEFAALRALSAERTPTGITALFAADLDAAVRDFVRRESECCPFLRFAVHTDEQGVRLDIDGPDDARPILDAFLDLARSGA